jgi:hypothetical protein
VSASKNKGDAAASPFHSPSLLDQWMVFIFRDM